MKNSNGQLAGILGTIILHLIAGIIFMSLQLRSLQKRIEKEYTVELYKPAERELPPEKKTEVVPTSVEKVLKGDEEMLNIAKNLAAKPDEKINASDYINKVKEELIKSGKLGTDNFIDDQKKPKSTTGNEDIAVGRDSTSKSSKETTVSKNFTY